jgi:hypothetical protein
MKQENQIEKYTRALAEAFTPELIAEILCKLPAAIREKLIAEFLVEKPVRRITRIIRKK